MDEATQRLVNLLLHLDDKNIKIMLADMVRRDECINTLEAVVVPALEHIGFAWEHGQLSLSQVYMAGRICEKAVSELLPAHQPSRPNSPKLAIGVIKDYHSLGKRMVISALRSSGYDLLDYGHGLSVDDLIRMALRDKLDVLMISCLMLTSAMHIRDVVTGLNRANHFPAIIVGGAPFRLDPGLWKEVGATATGQNSTDAVAIIRSLTKDRMEDT